MVNQNTYDDIAQGMTRLSDIKLFGEFQHFVITTLSLQL